MENNSGLHNLFWRYLNDECSPEEIKDLLKQFNVDENGEVLKSLIREHLELLPDENTDANNLKPVVDRAYLNLKRRMAGDSGEAPVRQIPFLKQNWLKIAAALVLSAAGTWFYYSLRPMNQGINTAAISLPAPGDITPGADKAVLTLADGTTIVLDSTASGELASQGNTKVIKLDSGQLTYNSSRQNSGEVLYNTVRTPRGGRYQLLLSDGSRVWLNAASSIRFPTVFSGKERKVEMTGEAYFEVAKKPSQPFKVNIVPGSGGVERMEVEVLGTHFNINAYSDEPDIKTTLLEGSVKIKNRQGGETRSLLLKPGEQAQAAHKSGADFRIEQGVDVDEIVAWKNGYFVFNGRNIKSIMREISLWYDVDVIYHGPVSTETFSGIVSRKSNISQVIKIMQEGGLKFKIEGKKITVIQE